MIWQCPAFSIIKDKIEFNMLLFHNSVIPVVQEVKWGDVYAIYALFIL